MSSFQASRDAIRNYTHAPQNLLKTVRDLEKRVEHIQEGQVHMKTVIDYLYLWVPQNIQDDFQQVIDTIDDRVDTSKQLLLALNVLDTNLCAAQEKGMMGLYQEISQIMQHNGMMHAMEVRSKTYTQYFLATVRFTGLSLRSLRLGSSISAPLPSTPPTSLYGFMHAVAALNGTLSREIRNFHGGDTTLVVRALAQALNTEEWLSE